MFNHINKNQRGDTIVEVLLATVVISIVIAGAYALTNRATRLNQTAIERTTATNAVKQQLEFIRGISTYARGSTAWTDVESYMVSTPPSYADCRPTTNRDFKTNTTGSYGDAATVADYDFDSDPNLIKVWAEAYRPSAAAGYVDIHVRACWQGIGGDGELGTQRSASILRLSL